MSWLFAQKCYRSEKNGLITCRKFFGRWIVEVEHYDQSSPYVKRMWRTALRRLPNSTTGNKILLLGLGAGSMIDDLHQKFPQAQIVVVEHDSEMVKVAADLKLFNYQPEIIVEDAFKAMRSLNELFDLIIVDLYRGRQTAEVLERVEFISTIEQKLAPTGLLLVNAFENTKLLENFSKLLTTLDSWSFNYNSLALYKKKSTEG